MLAEPCCVVCRIHVFALYCDVVHTRVLGYTSISTRGDAYVSRLFVSTWNRIDNAAINILQHHARKTE